MCMYSGIDDSTRIHPEEVDEDTVEKWLRGITGNKDNPRGAEESLHSTNPMNQTRSNPELPSVILIYHATVYGPPTDFVLLVFF